MHGGMVESLRYLMYRRLVGIALGKRSNQAKKKGGGLKERQHAPEWNKLLYNKAKCKSNPKESSPPWRGQFDVMYFMKTRGNSEDVYTISCS